MRSHQYLSDSTFVVSIGPIHTIYCTGWKQLRHAMAQAKASGKQWIVHTRQEFEYLEDLAS